MSVLFKYYNNGKNIEFDPFDSYSFIKPIRLGSLVYIEKYICEPNRDKSDVNLIKSHDMNLDFMKFEEEIEYNSKDKFIIQYRSFLPSFISLFKKFRNDNEKEFFETLFDWIVYWKKFIKKWVIEQPNNSNVIKINYDDLIKNPNIVIRNIILFLNLDNKEINIDLLNKIIKEENIDYKNPKYENFKYLNDKIKQKIEYLIKKETEDLQ
jgi:hypothetical protein